MSDKDFEKMVMAEVGLQQSINDFKKLCDASGVELRDRIEDLICNAKNDTSELADVTIVTEPAGPGDTITLEGELLDSLVSMVEQHCAVTDTGGETFHLDSMALSTNAVAMLLLARLGKLKVTDRYGRRVIGKWVE